MLRLTFVTLLIIGLGTSARADIRLPKLISDGMVLQRNADLNIWGWATPGATVTVQFLKTVASVTADENGNWSLTIGPYREGGPYDMIIRENTTVTIKNILIGEVWLCSGQSNMELTLYRCRDVYPEEITRSANDKIRQFLVPDTYDFKHAHDDLGDGSWVAVNPETIMNFSAVAYFFARDLYEKYHVPIGLINSALGGSPVQAWMSEETLKEFPRYYEEMQTFKNDELIQQQEAEAKKRIEEWHSRVNQKDAGLKGHWASGKANTSKWFEIENPGYADKYLGGRNGSVWYQKTVDLPASMKDKPGKIWLGRIVNSDSAYVNGTFVGSTSYEWPPRKYDIPANVLRKGENTITVRVINSSGRGGFVPEKEYFIASEKDTVQLSGQWRYQLGANAATLITPSPVRWKPGGLYNAMIAPLVPYRIKGVIWYQGESNVGNPYDYFDLFSSMIKSWRASWGIGDFPFLFVQLASYLQAQKEPSESNQALLREAQYKTWQEVSNTSMIVTTDIGVWNDIHPLNKLDVGKRLSLAAQHFAYGDNRVVYSGPVYKSSNKDGNKIEISFEHTGSGLLINGWVLKGFAIAGPDKKFVWARATVKSNKVIVWSDLIPNPEYVRYAWADNAGDANLYNRERLPAAPFRTDE